MVKLSENHNIWIRNVSKLIIDNVLQEIILPKYASTVTKLHIIFDDNKSMKYELMFGALKIISFCMGSYILSSSEI